MATRVETEGLAPAGVLVAVLARTNRTTRSMLAELGRFSTFSGRALAAVPFTIRRYWPETMRQFTDIAWGSGAILVGGGTIGVMVLLSIAAGTSLGIEGFSGLEVVGLAPLAGFVAAAVATREIAPLVAALALAAQVGCRFTAQIGSMRLHEEIDALEVMAVPSLPFLVTTRVIAGFIAIVPLYAAGLLTSYIASRLTVSLFYGQSLGTYDHYFNLFLPPVDILYSFLKVLVIAVLIILIHTYYGYRATGGPAGVGVAVGRSVRASLVLIFVFDIFVSLALWGSTTTVKIA